MNPMGKPNPGFGYGEEELAQFVSETLRRAGATVCFEHPLSGRPNVIGFFDAGSQETVLFEAHLDTVPADPVSPTPFSGEIRDGKLYGRGSADVKGPMAAMICGIVAGMNAAPARNVLFAAVCDEEYQFSGARHMVEGFSSGRFPFPVFAVVAEPTTLMPVVAHKGVVRWCALAQGRAAHSSTPELGDNAIYRMAEAVAATKTLAESLQRRSGHGELGPPSLNIGMIRGGSAVNIVPDHCVIEIDRRLIPGESVENATGELETLLSSVGVNLQAPYMAAPAFEESSGGAAVRVVSQVLKSMGQPADPQYANYCTDAPFYAAAGIPAVVFGPGDIRQAHTVDEWISADAIQTGADAYRRIVTWNAG